MLQERWKNHFFFGGGWRAGVDLLLLEEIVQGAAWVVRTP
jgi:hypothetical protein